MDRYRVRRHIRLCRQFLGLLRDRFYPAQRNRTRHRIPGEVHMAPAVGESRSGFRRRRSGRAIQDRQHYAVSLRWLEGHLSGTYAAQKVTQPAPMSPHRRDLFRAGASTWARDNPTRNYGRLATCDSWTRDTPCSAGTGACALKILCALDGRNLRLPRALSLVK